MTKQVAIVTGGSSGIGKNVAQLLCKEGYTVYEFSRSGENDGPVIHVNCDITDDEAVKNAVSQVAKIESRIDLLINNAGFGISGALEFTDIEDIKRIFDVNLLGAIRMVQAVVPHMRKCGKGRIVNVSSVAGDVALPFQSMYSASKAAMNSMTLSLRTELAPFCISVAGVMPGDASSGFTAARKKDHDGDDIYEGRINRSVAVMERDETNGMDSNYVAKRIVKVSLKEKALPLYTVGTTYKLFVVLAKLLPRSLSNKIVAMIYAK